MAGSSDVEKLQKVLEKIEKSDNPDKIKTLDFVKGLMARVQDPKFIKQKEYTSQIKKALEADDKDELCKLLGKETTMTTVVVNLVDKTSFVLDILCENTRVAKLILNCNFTKAKHFGKLFEFVSQSQSLNELQLCRSGVNCEIATSFAKYIESSQLQYLCLNDNNIGEVGGVELLGGLVQNKTLKLINFNGNNIGPLTCCSIATNLKSGTCVLRELILSDNPLGDEGVKEIMEGLAENSSLAMIGLMNVKCDDFTPVAEMLRKNTTLRSLYLNQNNINDETARVLLSAFEENKTLICLDLAHNNISKEIIVEIDKMMVRNRELCENLPSVRIPFEPAVSF